MMDVWSRRVLCFLTVALLVSACQQPDPAAGMMPPPPTVTVAAALQQELTQYAEFTGRFQASKRVEIRARVDGYLTRIAFEDGQIVNEGDLLFEIDQRPFKLVLAGAEADLTQARTRLRLAEKELKRVESLRDRRAVSVEELDRRIEERDTAAAAILSLEARLEEAKLDMTFTEVRAPITGRVSETLVDVGNLISGQAAGSTLLTTVVALDPLHFYIEASEQEVARITRQGNQALGVAVAVKLLAEDTYNHEGVIDFVDNEIDAATGTLLTRARFANRDYALQPGAFGRARVPMGRPGTVLLIPDTAVASFLTQKLVYMIGEDGTVQPRPVELGPLQSNGLRVITKGLNPGETLIINGLAKIRPGMPVNVEEGTIEVPTAPAGPQG
ncbi:efflux RND transporter periplasmic adaptor subunit [Acanthopleuribacter pedis]|uniref:Efflux RND transporter periplasmic adaptor subunit n=1 Tax=Acanthopleuribacter pedis TaxID=442870 RepID=A0A8J7U7W3_9BACT|nr:efflux RND transporter periplasmic adaptor subunit [Acanthopleuribacter pedis]MBO1323429.1 efflux RND transporter periplasmic adaptor subunit [Acanthopleuribacter pedis]